MGTRGIIGFRKNGQDKLTYNHFDSYPSGVGVEILKTLHNHSIKGQPNHLLVELHSAFDRIQLIDENNKPSPKQIEDLRGFANLQVSSGRIDEWYVLLRNAQGNLEAYLGEAGLEYMIDSHEFILDSLFCEWGYIINLDSGKLEVWRGFQKKPDKTNRYGHKISHRSEAFTVRELSGKTRKHPATNYYPCKLIKEYSLTALPTPEKFVSDLKGE